MNIDFLDNCKCAGITNEFEEGAECKVYHNYKDEYFNGVWCYAETEMCKEATEHNMIKSGRYGPSRSACLNVMGIVNSLLEKFVSIYLYREF